MKRIRLIIASLLAFSALTPAVALAYNPLDRACTGAAANSNVCKDAASQKKDTNPVVTIIADATRIILLIIGFASVIMIVASGIGLITSGGNSESVSGAKKRLTGAITGLVIAGLAWFLTSYIINRLL